jgi:hypothetical protein
MKTNWKIREWFEEAIEELYEQNFYLAAELTKLGYPEIIPADQYPPTAGVSWDEKKKKIKFMFNEGFFKNLTKEHFIFIVCHESIHVMNLHIFLFKDEYDKKKKKNVPAPEIQDHMRKLNVAADCVVNDSLTHFYGLERYEMLGTNQHKVKGGATLLDVAQKLKLQPPLVAKVNPGISLTDTLEDGQEINVPVVPLYGMDIIEMDTEDMTVMDVFYLLPEDLSQFGVGNHEQWKSFFNADGSINRDFVDKVKGFIQDNIENSALSDEELGKIEEMKDALEESKDAYAQQAGKEAVGSLRPIDGLGQNALNWNRILFKLTDTKKPRDIWNRSPRKMQSVYPDVILPTIEDQEKEDIFFAIDSSGSIDRNALTLFVDVVRNTPKHFRCRAITFDTMCYEYDIKRGEQPKGGGGTAFNIIEKYIQDNFKKYPKAIFVLTDGEGNHVDPQHPDRWCWLLYSYCQTRYIGNMKHYNIKDILK